MIPRVLQLKNFLSYSGQVQTVDFTPYSLICLSGKNGHGKSALLDAITWALWGQARKSQGSAKADEGVVRIGQARAFVDFEFEIDSTIYRVRREFFKGHGRPIAGLEFQISDPATARFKTLTGKTIRETQESIEKALKIDFDTFLNTAFFRQGSSNEFSKKTPKERKQILSNIMGLSKYDLMSEKAQERGRQFQDTLTKILTLQEVGLKEIEKIAALQQELQSIELLGLSSKQALEAKRAQIKAVEEKITQLDGVLRSVQELENFAAQLKEYCRLWRQVHRSILTSPCLERLETRKQQLKQLEKQLHCRQSNLLTISAQFLTVANALREQKLRLVRLVDEEEQRLALELARKKIAWQANEQVLVKINVEGSKLASRQAELMGQIEKHNKIVAAWSVEQPGFLVQQARQVKLTKYKEFCQQRVLVYRDGLFSAKAGIVALQQGEESCAVCPTCKRAVDQDFASTMLQKFIWQEACFKRRGARVKQLLAYIMAALTELNANLVAADERLVASKAATLKVADLTKDLDSLLQETVAHEIEVQKATTNLSLAREQFSVNELQLQLAVNNRKLLINQQFADVRLCNLRSQLQKLYPEKLQAKNLAAELKQMESELEKLEIQLRQAVQVLSEVKAQQVRKQTLLADYLQLKKRFVQQHGYAAAAKAQLLILAGEKKLYAEELAGYELQHQEALKKYGSIKQQLLQAQALQQNLAVQQAQVAVLKQEIDDYAILAQAFGKNGIQALMIESVIPEIESAANKILAQLSDDQATIFIEPLKDLKKGGYRESLDIKIADAAGIRPYEMFSGGEAFRIDFALRISISKLLAGRVGANLQTLIIDEGFGSQDQEGIARLMAAIYAVKSDFSKIIVVSHLQEMKDNFPVHFLVTKNLTGSSISLEFRG